MTKKYICLLGVQGIAVVLSGLVSKDVWFAIAVSVVGVLFNFLVSVNKPIGFLFGFVYAITNGILAYRTGVYATFGFMLLLQAPMAIYSFIAWGKKQKEKKAMKQLTPKGIGLMSLAMLLTGILMYFLLGKLNSTNVLLDDFFFVCSVTACLLLAFHYKSAYVVTLLSGLGGTVLWAYQMAATGSGFSIAVFYGIVSLNSVLAIYQQYFKKGSKAALPQS